MHDERPKKIGMKPPHPGDFIRTEILDELHLSVARAAEILGVRRATLMEVHFTPDVEVKLKALATETGRAVDEFVQDAASSSFLLSLGKVGRDRGIMSDYVP